jgi:hypothetical protein
MAPKRSTHRCHFCGKPFETIRALNHHISASKSCYTEWRKDLVRNDNPSPKRQQKYSPGNEECPDNLEEFYTDPVDDFVPPSPPRCFGAEDVEQDEGLTDPTRAFNRYVEAWPGDAGLGIRKSRTQFEEWLKIQESEGKNPWEPFASKDEWALAEWLLKNVGQKSINNFLKLKIVSQLTCKF